MGQSLTPGFTLDNSPASPYLALKFNVLEMGDGDNVPELTGQGASVEAVRVTDKMRDNHFDNLAREPGGRR